MTAQAERFAEASEPKGTTLPELVKEFFDILDTVEMSDNNREFHPTTIGSCRVLHTAKLSKLLPKMKELASNGLVENT